MTLRARLLLGLIALAVLGLAVTGAVTYHEQKNFLLHRVDSEVKTAADNRALFFPETGGGRSSNGVPPGTYAQLIDDTTGEVTGQIGAFSEVPAIPRARLTAADGSLFTTHDPHFRAMVTRVTITEGRFTPPVPGRLVVAIPLRDVDDTLHRLLFVELIVALAVVLALGVMAWWVVKLGLKPLREMQATAGKIAAGDLSQRVEVVDENTEVGQLGLALNEMLQQIERAFAERAESEERLRRFVGDASHELRTPLTSIRGYAELFRRGAADRPEDLAKTMRRIEEEAGRMGVLVDDLLLLARLDQGRPLERLPVDLTRITADAVDDTRAIAPSRYIDYSPNGAIVVPGDEVRLRQVLGNLLQNAVRHTPAGAPVHVSVTAEPTEAVIEVRDEGPGMTADDAARVFERFWRADASRNRSSGGSGLGLAIVAAIVQAHGGRAEVVTAPGAGATFRVHLPRSSPAAPASEPPVASVPIAELEESGNNRA